MAFMWPILTFAHFVNFVDSEYVTGALPVVSERSIV
jgi:hypothetical protein